MWYMWRAGGRHSLISLDLGSSPTQHLASLSQLSQLKNALTHVVIVAFTEIVPDLELLSHFVLRMQSYLPPWRPRTALKEGLLRKSATDIKPTRTCSTISKQHSWNRRKIFNFSTRHLPQQPPNPWK